MVKGDTLPCIDKPTLCYQCGGIFISKASLKTHIESEHVKCKAMDTGDINNYKKEEGAGKVQHNKKVLSFKNDPIENKNATVDSLKEKPSRVISYPAQSAEIVVESSIKEKKVDPWNTLLLNVKTFFNDQNKRQKLNISRDKESKSKIPKKTRMSKMELYKIKLQEKKGGKYQKERGTKIGKIETNKR